jgi:hypothetical protein
LAGEGADSVKSLAASSVVAVLVVVLGGCGGGEEEDLSKQEFVDRADAICADTNKKEAALDPGGPGWHFGPKFDDPEFLSRFSDVGRDAIRRLRALDAPEEDQETHEMVMSSLTRMVEAMDDAVAALRSKQRAKHRTAAEDYETAYTDGATSGAALGSKCQGLGV